MPSRRKHPESAPSEREENRLKELASEPAKSLAVLVVTAAMVGLGTGFVAAGFRKTLDYADDIRGAVLNWTGDVGWYGIFIAIAVPAILTAAAAGMVRRWEPIAEGSGIPRVEATVRGDVPPSRVRLLPVKFVGGVAAIGSGLALGREGPSVHMGGAVATILGRIFHTNKADLRLLIAAGAAAGLTTAFSAPLAGAVFVLEELVKKFEARMTVAVLTASGGAFVVVHQMLGDQVMFPLPPVEPASLKHAPVILITGLLAGAVAVFYNSSLMRLLAIVDTSRIPVELRAAFIGGMVGLVGWFAPDMVGGGDNLTFGALLGHGTLAVAVGILVLRFVLAVGSYLALTPGGLFAPMLVLGAEIGVIVSLAANYVVPGSAPHPGTLAIMGMAAFFAASVRAPVTGLVLTTEMTGAVSLLPPLLGICAASIFVAEFFKAQPIYDALADRSARLAERNERALDQREKSADISV
ncbi:chloride channel protein [Corynebacterium falsenii DSM 44353]|uniref:H(+)/Cl(-) exchange transporter ClcA n=1 Tax=Corynebacterium falsenii TaxID=108486 RepID=UPI0003E94BA4|nr:H(+)/Cl(-) exchange transporter ClcA [Corynebacterium falsenii]AHI02243.1 chloride channel protein [Corynebacterium falsenii DSM 44353]UBI05012.1 H(+)/Cl(-) exchange transporter ClcA [Corynebacterium falsenii]